MIDELIPKRRMTPSSTRRMKLSTVAGSCWLPVGDHDLVGVFLLFDELSFAAPELGVVVVVGGTPFRDLGWVPCCHRSINATEPT